jgi:hypothetical protein
LVWLRIGGLPGGESTLRLHIFHRYPEGRAVSRQQTAIAEVPPNQAKINQLRNKTLAWKSPDEGWLCGFDLVDCLTANPPYGFTVSIDTQTVGRFRASKPPWPKYHLIGKTNQPRNKKTSFGKARMRLSWFGFELVDCLTANPPYGFTFSIVTQKVGRFRDSKPPWSK